MTNTLFIQFYSKNKYKNSDRFFYEFCNGFSDTYDYCKNIGDLIWVNGYDMDNFEMPFEKGTVYVSSFYLKHLVQASKWADQYPEINFVVGGPSVLIFSGFTKQKNLHLYPGSVEEYFGIENFSYDWKLSLENLSDDIHSNDTIYFTYTIDSSCYWNKCKFCLTHYGKKRTRENFDLSVIDKIDFDGEKHVRLQSPALKKGIIQKIMPQLKYQPSRMYDLLVRCDYPIYTELEKQLTSYETIPNLDIYIGPEFPNDKMLKFMDKGFTVNDVNNTINILKKFENLSFNVCFICVWPNLTKDDVNDLEIFLNNSPCFRRLIVRQLFCFNRTIMHELFLDRRKQLSYEGKIYKGYFPNLTDEERKINMQAMKLFKEKNTTSKYYYIKDKSYLHGDIENHE